MAMKSSELVSKAINIAKNHNTLYVMGCLGAPLTGSYVSKYCTNHQYNRRAERTAMIKAAANKNPPVYGFDCVCLIKSIVWGWCADPTKRFGGAGYGINGCPDYSADGTIKICKDVTSKFNTIIPGEALWMSGHIGIYIGDGLAVECTPSWANKVQITAVGNIGPKSGYPTRTWTKHGKLPYIDYSDNPASVPSTTPSTPAATTGGIKVGDIVNFTGNVHYTNANATTGKVCKSGKAKVTATYNGKHPYQLIAVKGGGSTVYGWVNTSDIATASTATSTSYKAKMNTAKAKALNIRDVPGYKSGTTTPAGKVVGCIRDASILTIIEEQNGWGKLGDGRGWVSLTYIVKC